MQSELVLLSMLKQSCLKIPKQPRAWYLVNIALNWFSSLFTAQLRSFTPQERAFNPVHLALCILEIRPLLLYIGLKLSQRISSIWFRLVILYPPLDDASKVLVLLLVLSEPHPPYRLCCTWDEGSSSTFYFPLHGGQEFTMSYTIHPITLKEFLCSLSLGGLPKTLLTCFLPFFVASHVFLVMLCSFIIDPCLHFSPGMRDHPYTLHVAPPTKIHDVHLALGWNSWAGVVWLQYSPLASQTTNHLFGPCRPNTMTLWCSHYPSPHRHR